MHRFKFMLCINLYANMQCINSHIYHLSMESSVYAFKNFHNKNIKFTVESLECTLALETIGAPLRSPSLAAALIPWLLQVLHLMTYPFDLL